GTPGHRGNRRRCQSLLRRAGRSTPRLVGTTARAQSDFSTSSERRHLCVQPLRLHPTSRKRAGGHLPALPKHPLEPGTEHTAHTLTGGTNRRSTYLSVQQTSSFLATRRQHS